MAHAEKGMQSIVVFNSLGILPRLLTEKGTFYVDASEALNPLQVDLGGDLSSCRQVNF